MRDPRTDRAFKRAASVLVVVAPALLVVWLLPGTAGIVKLLAVFVGVIVFLGWLALRPARPINKPCLNIGSPFDYHWSHDTICSFCGKSGHWNWLTFRRDARFTVAGVGGIPICEHCVWNAVVTGTAPTPCDFCGKGLTTANGGMDSYDGMKRICGGCLNVVQHALQAPIIPPG